MDGSDGRRGAVSARLGRVGVGQDRRDPDAAGDERTARREWARDGGDEAVRRYYDEVWVYGDPGVHDLREATGMAQDVAARTHHVGYLAADRIPPTERDERPPNNGRDYVLIMLGGGQDGAALARAAAAATVPDGVDLVILTGPQLPESDLRALRRVARRRPPVHVQRFSRHGAAWLENAVAAVTMGGANTVAEILEGDTPALVVPRVTPRAEQLVRARSLAACGALDVLHPASLSPEALTPTGSAPRSTAGSIAAACASTVSPRWCDVPGLSWPPAATTSLMCQPTPGNAWRFPPPAEPPSPAPPPSRTTCPPPPPTHLPT